VRFEPAMVMRMTWKEMKTIMATYTRKHQTTQTFAFDNLLDWIAIPSVDRTVFVQLLQQYSRQMNRINMAWKSNLSLFPCSLR
jgi:hypothetical protein